MDQTYCLKCMRPTGGTEVCPYCGYVAGETPPAPNALRPGTILDGRYLLGEPLGQGGFGITYIARDLNLDIRVAIKEYFPSGYTHRNAEISDSITVTDERLRLDVQKGKISFLKEARTLARFRGTPGIVDVLNFFEANDTAYIVMEFLEGETLASRLKRQLFTADEIFRLMGPIFDTLEKIHRQGVVHRDVSPDNIMLLPDGSLKLMDFGAARLMNYGDQRSVSVVLKAGYAPKEQYSSKGQQGPWTDIYALCATIYKCITGITPDNALDRVDGDDLKWPSELGFAISERQEAVLRQGMAMSQGGRFQSIKALRTALRREPGGNADSGSITKEPGSSDDTAVVMAGNRQTGSTEKKPSIGLKKKPDAERREKIRQKVGSSQEDKVVRIRRKTLYLWGGGAVVGLIVLALVLIALLGGNHKEKTDKTLAVSQASSVPSTTVPASAAASTDASTPTPTKKPTPTPTKEPTPTPTKKPTPTPTKEPTPTPTKEPTPTPTKKPTPTPTKKPTPTPHQHVWRSATYTSPETCAECGATRGNVKGYIGDVYGTWDDTPTDIAGWSMYPLDFGKIENCRQLTVCYCITDYTDVAWGAHEVYVHIPGTGWNKIGTLSLSQEDVINQEWVYLTITFDTPITFTKVMTLPNTGSGYFWFDLYLGDVQVYVD